MIAYNARIKARGAYEVARWSRERDVPPVGPSPVIWQRHEYLLRSDGEVLSKHTVKWSDGQRHDYGWKLWSKVKAGYPVEKQIEIVDAHLIPKGFLRVSANPPPAGVLTPELKQAVRHLIYEMSAFTPEAEVLAIVQRRLGVPANFMPVVSQYAKDVFQQHKRFVRYGRNPDDVGWVVHSYKGVEEFSATHEAAREYMLGYAARLVEKSHKPATVIHPRRFTVARFIWKDGRVVDDSGYGGNPIDPRSVRVLKRGRKGVAIGCEAGQWDARNKRCLSGGIAVNPAKSIANEEAARELQLYIENDADLYRQQYQPIIKNLMLKRAKGIYDLVLSVKLWMYLVDNGARKYAKEFGVPNRPASDIFSRATRLVVAQNLAINFRAEANLGHYDSYLPKKYGAGPIRPDFTRNPMYGRKREWPFGEYGITSVEKRQRLIRLYTPIGQFHYYDPDQFTAMIAADGEGNYEKIRMILSRTSPDYIQYAGRQEYSNNSTEITPSITAIRRAVPAYRRWASAPPKTKYSVPAVPVNLPDPYDRLGKVLDIRVNTMANFRRPYNPWAVCRSMQNKYDWSDRKTER